MPTIDLRRLLEDEKFTQLIKFALGTNQKFETFTGQRQLIPIAAAYVMKWKSTHHKLLGLVASVDDLALLCKVLPDPSRHRSLFVLLISVVQELRAVFRVPKPYMSNTSPMDNDWGPKEEVTVFIHFLHQILEKIMDLIPNFIVSPIKDSTEILQTELEFLITFLGDAPMRLQGVNAELTKNVLEDIRVFVNQVGGFLYPIFSARDYRVLLPDRLDFALSGLLQKSELLKVKIKNHCTLVTLVSELLGSASIKTGVSRLFMVDSLLDDLKDFIDHKADKFGYMRELMLLRSSLDNVVLAQFAEAEEVVIPTRDLVYEIEYVINSSPPWYLALRVPQFLEKIQIIRMAIQEKNKCGQDGYAEEEYPLEQLTEILTSQEQTSIFMGFEHTATEITEKLIGGPPRQQILSLVGMPGIGKTTMAHRLFSDPSVIHHFDKRAWCIVSQTYILKSLLIDILASTRHLKRETMMQMEEDQLGEELYKSLKRMRYLIVLDDIWDIRPWHDLEKYFPDDGTTSRILFTTRNREVGLRASPNNIIALPFLSDNECWELIQQKLFPTRPCPQELLEIGKEIANSCRGLPL